MTNIAWRYTRKQTFFLASRFCFPQVCNARERNKKNFPTENFSALAWCSSNVNKRFVALFFLCSLPKYFLCTQFAMFNRESESFFRELRGIARTMESWSLCRCSVNFDYACMIIKLQVLWLHSKFPPFAYTIHSKLLPFNTRSIILKVCSEIRFYRANPILSESWFHSSYGSEHIYRMKSFKSV